MSYLNPGVNEPEKFTVIVQGYPDPHHSEIHGPGNVRIQFDPVFFGGHQHVRLKGPGLMLYFLNVRPFIPVMVLKFKMIQDIGPQIPDGLKKSPVVCNAGKQDHGTSPKLIQGQPWF
jgi:hypothetical protein